MKNKPTLLTLIFCLCLCASGNAFETILTDETLESGDYYGYGIAISGNYAFVSAYRDDDEHTDSGAVYIFHRENNTWVKQQKIKASDPGKNDHFGYAIDIDGDTAIVGAYNKNSSEGAAYIFEKNSNIWQQKGKLVPEELDDYAYFGHSVSISGNTIVVGAPYDRSNNYGSAYIFIRGDNGWSLQQVLTYDQYVDQKFGYSVAIDGDFIVVGRPFSKNQSNNIYYNYVSLHKRNGDKWSRKANALWSTSNDSFGCTVSISDQYVIMGASRGGYACIYQITNNGSSLTHKKTFTPNNSVSNFGCSVSISKNYAVVGGYGSKDPTYIYTLKNDNWYFHSVIPNNSIIDAFGQSVSISDETFMIGAYEKENNTGAAYVYDISEMELLSISGYVMDSSNKPCPNTTIQADNHYTETTTDQNGYFSLKVGYGYKGKIVPKNDPYTFRPKDRDFSFVTTNYTHQYFFLDAFTISGTITDPKGTPIPGVEIIFSDNVGGISSIFTNSQGYYSYQLYSNFSGTAFPTGMGYKYDPIRIPYDNLSENQLNQNYTGYRFTIAGYCIDENGAPIGNVLVSFLPGNMQTITDEYGYYSQDVPYLWSGIMTLEKVGVDFQNKSKTFTGVESNLFGTDFWGKEKKYTISGMIYNQKNQPLEDVRVCFSENGDCVTTNNDGFYEKILPFGADCFVSANHEGFIITPESRLYTNLSADQLSQNYTANIIHHVVSGQIIDKDADSTPLSNVSVSFGNQIKKTDPLGRFHWESIYGNAVDIVPEKEGYLFFPSHKKINKLAADMPDLVFTAERERFLVKGRVIDTQSNGVPGVTVKISGKEKGRTDENGYYQFQIEYGYCGAVEIFLENYLPVPGMREINFVNSDINIQEFSVQPSDISPKSILVYPDIYNVSDQSDSFMFDVLFSPQNLNWEVVTEDGWIQVTRTNDNVLVSYDDNISEQDRFGVIEVKALYATNSPQQITLTQSGRPEDIVGPNWKEIFNPSIFQYQLTMTAIVKDDSGQLLDKQANMLAAFCGDELRGVAHPIETSMGTRYFLIIYSNRPADDDICFKFYDATKDWINVNIQYPITFESDAILGNIQQPHELVISDYFVRIALNKYWNWVTINVENLDDMSVKSVLKSLGNHGDMIVGQEGFCHYDHGSWSGGFNQLNHLRMYKILTNDPCVLEYSGNALDIGKIKLSLKKGWNWLGYLPSSEMSLDQALAEIKSNAIMVTGQKGFSFNTDSGWYGSLKVLEPNHGYKIQMGMSDELVFPEIPQATPRTRSLRKRTRSSDRIWTSNNSQYEYQTTVTAQVYLNDTIIGSTGDALAGFVNGECRGIAPPTETPFGPMYFLQIWGKPEELIQLRFYHAAETEVYDLDISWQFRSDASDGTIDSPKQIHLDSNPCGNQPKWTVDSSKYQHQGMITAIVTNGNSAITKKCDLLAAFVNNTCRGVAQAQETDYGIRFFLSVWGDKNQEMTFKYFQAEDDNIYTIANPVMFTPMVAMGTVSSPKALSIKTFCFDCEKEIEKCNENLSSCENILADFKSKYTKCDTNYQKCQTDLFNCTGSLETCQEKVGELTLDLIASRSYAITLSDGWHMISGVNSDVTPTTNPPDCIQIMYEFRDGTYEEVKHLSATRGVWVKIKKECLDNSDKGFVDFYVDGN